MVEGRARRLWFMLLASAFLLLLNVGGMAQREGGAVMDLMARGRDAMQRGDLAAAEVAFREARDRAPDLSDTYLGLGLVELRLGKLDEAAKSLQRATELNPQLPGAHLFLGISEYQLGQSDAALASLRAELKINPSNIEALKWLGIAALGSDKPEEAVEPLDRAARLHPDDASILYYKGRAHSRVAESSYQELYRLDPDSALVHRALAESLSASGQPEKAISEYEAAIRKEPQNSDLYEGLGDENQKMSRSDAAKTAYEKELDLNPNSAIALYNLGKIDVETGKPESGIERLRRAQAAHARIAPTSFYLGLGLAETGHNDEAAVWLEKCLANQPSPFIRQSAYFQLARVYQKLNRKSDAAAALEKLKILKAEAAKNITRSGQIDTDATSVSAGSAAAPQP